MITRRWIRAAFPAVVLGLQVAACGKKGPPLAPLRLVPEQVGEASARRTGNTVRIDFVLPSKNLNGTGAVDLDRVEIYAVTLAAGARVARAEDVTGKQQLVGTIEVKPPAAGEQKQVPSEDDTRPAPGERASFVEELTAGKLQPTAAPEGEVTEKPAAGSQIPSDVAARLYVIRAVSRGGRSAPQGRRIAVPLVPPPPPPGGVAVRTTERSYVLDWTAPVAQPGEPAIVFNVYAAEGKVPLNPSPLDAATLEYGPVKPAQSTCFTVRSVQVVQDVAIESEMSAPACATWADVYPPTAPKGLQAVAADDGVSLSWDANTEEDLAGYVVLRGEAPGDTLQPLTREPIRETAYRDTTVSSGVRYVYAVIALDRAAPPNASVQSARQEVTAR